MSEFQYVVFQAVDRPLDDKQLAFAEQQSSRADVTRWSLSVEYHYSSFRGDVDALLRRGYDAYLQYTNYGDREIKLRLPNGFPFGKRIWSRYVDSEHLSWKKDSKGSGGILSLHPYHESSELEEVWEFQKYLDAAIGIRELLIGGDLRALYLLWLCAANDDYNDPAETIEPPVPHGLIKFPEHCAELLSFYGLDPLLLTAAGKGLDDFPNRDAQERPMHAWVDSIENSRAKELLKQMLCGDTASLKASLLAEIRDSQSPMI